MTAQEDFNSFLEGQKADDYNFAGMTPEEQDQEMRTYTELKLAVAKETEKISAFTEAKDAEFEKLRLKQDAAKIQFGKDCQTAEDAGYDLSQIPDGSTY